MSQKNIELVDKLDTVIQFYWFKVGYLAKEGNLIEINNDKENDLRNFFNLCKEKLSNE